MIGRIAESAWRVTISVLIYLTVVWVIPTDRLMAVGPELTVLALISMVAAVMSGLTVPTQGRQP